MDDSINVVGLLSPEVMRCKADLRGDLVSVERIECLVPRCVGALVLEER
jgi:hypothetical protein